MARDTQRLTVAKCIFASIRYRNDVVGMPVPSHKFLWTAVFLVHLARQAGKHLNA
ncbi:MAG: hypothetical protein ABSG32_33105 [Terriglobia bacterium]